MAVFDIRPPSLTSRSTWTRRSSAQLPSDIAHSFVISVALAVTIWFAWWWFNPSHVPDNFLGMGHWLDVAVFVLVSYVIWQPIIMEVLTWALSLGVRPPRYQDPPSGLKVAFITTIVPAQESLELLHNILPAMVKAGYPHDSWLLDEGDSDEVKAICEQYGVKHFSRRGIDDFNTPTGKFTKTKGGNHNSWYEAEGNAYDIVAQIDTDFVPEPDFLTRTLGYFRDSKVAFVGTPQVYGNTGDSIVAKGAAEQLHNFYGPVLQGLSGAGMSLMIGANHIVRVAALRSVDHYTAHITEDLITGMKLHAHGWKSVYVPIPLAVGEGPFTWEAYFTQQMRWAYGCFDILFRRSPRLLLRMSLRRKIRYFFLMQHYFSGLAMAVSIFLLSLYFAFGMRAANVDLFKFVVIYSLVATSIWITSVWLQHFHIAWKRESHLMLAGTVINVAVWPIYFLALLKAIRGKKLVYKVTPKGGVAETGQTPLRLFVPHFVFGGIALVAFASSFFTGRRSPVMEFWALSSAMLLLAVPFTDRVARLVRRVGARMRGAGARAYGVLGGSEAAAVAAGGPETAQAGGRREAGADVTFLAIIVILSMALYLTKLGFYSDDWAFIGNFTTSASHSLVGLVHTATTPNTVMRPMQNVYDAALFMLFGVHPLGYQLVNGGVFLGVVTMFYLVLRQLRMPRVVAVGVPLVFALLPNFSTDRFWYAAFQVNLSMLLYFISVYAGLRGILAPARADWWKLASVVSLILCILSYEIVLPLVFINLVIFWMAPRWLGRGRGTKIPDQTVFVVLNLAVLAYLVIFKLMTTTRMSRLNYLAAAGQILRGSVRANFGTWGVDLPAVWAQMLRHYAGPWTVALMLLVGGAIGVYLYRLLGSSPLPGRRFLRNLAFAGVGVFFGGYAIFVTNLQVEFSPTGIDNRAAIAASIGIAMLVIAVVGRLVLLIPRESWRRMVFSVAVAVFGAGGFLAINSVASFWSTASAKQQAVLSDIHRDFPKMASGSTVFLDGVCPYVGPGIVFESQWDLTGALQSYYDDPTIHADIVTPRLKVEPQAIDTQIYTFPAKYPYNYATYIYNFKNQGIYLVRDAAAANKYFAKYDPTRNNNCPAATAGSGVKVF